MRSNIPVSIHEPVEFQMTRLAIVALELDRLEMRLDVLRQEAKHHPRNSVIRRTLEENITTMMFEITALRERLRYLQSMSDSQE
jgi:hypothetical protein